MSDDWEIAHALNPRDAGDAMLDPDGDEFTNVQEHFAATDPHDATSFPGQPSDPLATHQTRALLRYLALRPWREQALVGQMVSDNTTDYAAYVAALAAQPEWGRWPAILGLAVEAPTFSMDIAASVDHAIPYANAGGLVQIKWAMWNPWTGGNMGDQSKIDIAGLLDPLGTPTTNNTAAENQAARAVVLGWIDLVATEIKRYNLATDSKPLLFRPLSEMNGAWFWWGHRTRSDYLGLWNLIRDRLMTHHGLHNIIWVYESAQTEHVHPVPSGSAAASDYYYPGDGGVDAMCHNLYDDDWDLPFDANKVYSKYPKIYGVPQAGPGKDKPDSRDGHFDNMNYLNQISARYPRMSFFIVWNSIYTNGGNTHSKIAIIESTHPEQLMINERAVTRDELRWLPPANPAADVISSSALTATWSDVSMAGQNETGFQLETAPGAGGPWSAVAITAPDATSSIAGALPAGSQRWLRVRSLFDNDDDSLPTDPISAMTWSYFQQWKNDKLGYFNAPDLDDDDGDGLVSVLEYGLGTEPLEPSTSEQPTQGMTNVSGAEYLTLTFRRRIGASDLSYVVESTGDLVLGPWMPDPVPFGLPADNGDGTETVTFRDIIPLGGVPARFLRLRMSTP